MVGFRNKFMAIDRPIRMILETPADPIVSTLGASDPDG